MATNTHSLVLQPGESFTLPPNSSLLFVSTPDNITSDCIEIPDTTYQCGYFVFYVDKDANDEHPGDENSSRIEWVKVGNTTYGMEQRVITSGENPGTLVTLAALNAYATDPDLFSFTQIDRDTSFDKRQAIVVFFKVVDTLFDELEMVVSDHFDVYYTLKPIEQDCEDYTMPTLS